MNTSATHLQRGAGFGPPSSAGSPSSSADSPVGKHAALAPEHPGVIPHFVQDSGIHPGLSWAGGTGSAAGGIPGGKGRFPPGPAPNIWGPPSRPAGSSALPSNVAAQVYAAAAAAIEQPTQLPKERFPPSDRNVNDAIRIAQEEATQRRMGGVEAAQSAAAGLRRSGNDDIGRRQSMPGELPPRAGAAMGGQGETIDRLIRGAQTAARGQKQSPLLSGYDLKPEDFLGNWADSQGNQVLVYSTDAWEMRLTAALSRPPRPDIYLGIRQDGPAGDWICGNSTLRLDMSSIQELHWSAADGRLSVWTRARLS